MTSATMDHMSQKQFNQISQHISTTSMLSLSQIETSIELYMKSIEKSKRDLNILERAEHIGIQIRLLNKIKGMDQKTLSEDQKVLLNTYNIEDLQLQNERFCQELQEKIRETQSELDDLIKIKAVFVEHYPEAHSSPRLSRQELESSPRRSSTEGKSSSANITTSPARAHSFGSTIRATASSLMASPRRSLAKSTEKPNSK